MYLSTGGGGDPRLCVCMWEEMNMLNQLQEGGGGQEVCGALAHVHMRELLS